MTTKMKIADLRTDGLQTRLALSEADVKEYAEKMDEGIAFDPLVVFADGEDRYLADGFHRLQAMKRRGMTEVEVDLREGTRTEALRYSLGSNAKHGRKLTAADNRHKLEIAWANQKELFGGRPSHELLAQTCAVSTKTVQRFLKRISTLDTVQGCDGQPIVALDGKDRKVQPVVTSSSTLDTVQGCEPVTSAESPAKQAEGSPAKVAESDKSPEGWHRYDPTTIFQTPKTDAEYDMREEYVASLYRGEYTEKYDNESFLKKDRSGTPVPRGLSRKLSIAGFCEYELVYQCLSRAYSWMEDYYEAYRMDHSRVFGRFFQHENDPMGLIEDLFKACEDSVFSNVCRHCGGKGCAKCGHMGFATCGDRKDEFARKREEAKKAAETAVSDSDAQDDLPL